ncbi:hypothetical protein HXX01_02795 [Candidatus Nomurabacteria bacterium]|nr:hypothetical protein [Candidatus Nomurabacteria bacterium]
MEGPKPNTLKSEHLNSEFKPIIGGIYDGDSFDQNIDELVNSFKKNGEFVNFVAKEKELQEKNFLNNGAGKYVISPCDSLDKYSLSYLDCTGIVAVGVDKKTGKNVSFMSHQDPEVFLRDEETKQKFKKDLSDSIDKLIASSVQDSVDVVIFGGQYERQSHDMPDDNFRLGVDNTDDYLEDSYSLYLKSIKFLNFNLSKQLGFSPVVMTGPNDNFYSFNNATNVYFDNENRRLYLIRPKQEVSKKNEPFVASSVEQQIDRIKNNDAK